MKIENKNFKVKEIKADKGQGSAIIAELNVIDHDGDVTLAGAFGEQHVNLLPAHDFHAPRLGKAILKEDADFAVADFRFNLDDDAHLAKEWYSALKFDMQNGEPLQEWSYGFEVLEFSFGEFQGKEVRFLKKLKVHEISPVIRGAGIGTGTLAIKSKDKMTFKDQNELAVASLADVVAFIERSKSLADLKAKDGKSLSDEKVETLMSFASLLEKALGDCKELTVRKDDDSANIEEVYQAYARFQHLNFA